MNKPFRSLLRFLSAYEQALQKSAEGYLNAEQKNYSEIWKLWI